MFSTIVLIVWTAIRIEIAIRFWELTVFLAHFSGLGKITSIVLLILIVLLLIWGFADALNILRRIGVKTAIAITVVLISFAVVRNTSLTVGTPNIFIRLKIGTIITAARIRRVVSETILAVIAAPDEFLFAYTGKAKKLQIPPGFPTPDPSMPRIRVVVSPASPGPEPTELKPGGYARIKGSGNDKAVVRSHPLPDAMVTARFSDNERVLILAGPKGESRLEGDPSQWKVYEWWKVHGISVDGSSGEGWIVDTWLIPSN